MNFGENSVELAVCVIKPHQRQISAFGDRSWLRYSNRNGYSFLAFVKIEKRIVEVLVGNDTSKVEPRLSCRFRHWLARVPHDVCASDQIRISWVIAALLFTL